MIKRHLISAHKRRIAIEVGALLPSGTMIVGNSAALLFEGKLTPSHGIHCLCKSGAMAPLVDDQTPRDSRGRFVLTIGVFVFFIDTYREETTTRLTNKYKCVYDIAADILYMTKSCEGSLFPVRDNTDSLVAHLVMTRFLSMLLVFVVTCSGFLLHPAITFCLFLVALICILTGLFWIEHSVGRHTNRLLDPRASNLVSRRELFAEYSLQV